MGNKVSTRKPVEGGEAGDKNKKKKKGGFLRSIRGVKRSSFKIKPRKSRLDSKKVGESGDSSTLEPPRIVITSPSEVTLGSTNSSKQRQAASAEEAAAASSSSQCDVIVESTGGGGGAVVEQNNDVVGSNGACVTGGEVATNVDVESSPEAVVVVSADVAVVSEEKSFVDAVKEALNEALVENKVEAAEAESPAAAAEEELAGSNERYDLVQDHGDAQQRDNSDDDEMMIGDADDFINDQDSTICDVTEQLSVPGDTSSYCSDVTITCENTSVDDVIDAVDADVLDDKEVKEEYNEENNTVVTETNDVKPEDPHQKEVVGFHNNHDNYEGVDVVVKLDEDEKLSNVEISTLDSGVVADAEDVVTPAVTPTPPVSVDYVEGLVVVNISEEKKPQVIHGCFLLPLTANS